MRRTFGLALLARPRCGWGIRLVPLIEQGSVIQRILRHLGLPTGIPSRVLRELRRAGRTSPTQRATATGCYRLGRGPSGGNEDPTGDVPVALPVGSLAREERVVRRWLDVAVDVERPRRDPVLARRGGSPIERPEPPGIAARALPARG